MKQPGEPVTLGDVFACAVAAIFLSGVVLLGWQVFHWLETGVWTSMSINDALRRAGSLWAVNPQSYYGLHKLFNALPLAGVAIGGPSIGLAIVLEFNSTD